MGEGSAAGASSVPLARGTILVCSNGAREGEVKGSDSPLPLHRRRRRRQRAVVAASPDCCQALSVATPTPPGVPRARTSERGRDSPSLRSTRRHSPRELARIGQHGNCIMLIASERRCIAFDRRSRRLAALHRRLVHSYQTGTVRYDE